MRECQRSAHTPCPNAPPKSQSPPGMRDQSNHIPHWVESAVKPRGRPQRPDLSNNIEHVRFQCGVPVRAHAYEMMSSTNDQSATVLLYTKTWKHPPRFSLLGSLSALYLAVRLKIGLGGYFGTVYRDIHDVFPIHALVRVKPADEERQRTANAPARVETAMLPPKDKNVVRCVCATVVAALLTPFPLPSGIP
jgi:hypothetical protein